MEREGTNEEPPAPINPTPVDKKQTTVKSAKVCRFSLSFSLSLIESCISQSEIITAVYKYLLHLCSSDI